MRMLFGEGCGLDGLVDGGLMVRRGGGEDEDMDMDEDEDREEDELGYVYNMT